MRTRALEAYWSGFASWWLAQLDRRWCRTELGDRLGRAALDLGAAIVAERHGGSDVRLRVDQLAWLVETASRTGFLSAAEQREVETAIGVVRGLCPRERARLPGGGLQEPG